MIPNVQTAQFFHHYAVDFDAIYGSRQDLISRAINQLFRKSMRLRFEQTLNKCQPCRGKRILDVGTGPGHYALALAHQGAAEVVGLDFAKNMLDLATSKAQEADLGQRCRFIEGDFLTFEPKEPFDYVILMGFMDYMADPEKVIRKALQLARERVVFSFPVAGGFLGFQRKMRYLQRCPLYLYREDHLHEFLILQGARKYTIERLDRDFFVTVDVG